MITRTTRITIQPEDEPIFSEQSTSVYIADECGGEFVIVEQDAPDHGYGKIAINAEEWPEIRKAINKLVKLCRDTGDATPEIVLNFNREEVT